MFDVLGVLFVALRVPEDHHVLAPLLFEHSVHQGVGKIAPQVVGSDVGEEDMGVHRQCQPQAIALPRDAAQIAARHPQGPQVLACRRVELHDAHLPVRPRARLLLGLHAGDGDGRAVGIPPQSCAPQLRVDEHRLVVGVRAHDLHAAVLEAHAECRDLIVGPDEAGVPMDAGDGHRALGAIVQAIDWHPVGVDALCVVDVDLPVQSAEQDVLAIRRPFHKCQLRFNLLAPQSLPIHGADNDRTVLVDDADLLEIRTPLHVSDHTAIAIVDHLLKPDTTVQHPDDDKTVLVAGGELSEVVIPRDDHDVALVPLQGLVHGQVALCARGLRRGFRRGLQLQHLEQTALAAASYPSLCRVPRDDLERQVVRDGDLFAKIHEHAAPLHRRLPLAPAERLALPVLLGNATALCACNEGRAPLPVRPPAPAAGSGLRGGCGSGAWAWAS
mmetsp:Transcript_83961/g.271329  ORF Transcript_83961/g.271329 Transcript_83961/m.271329 type:complete len:442 (+) Transcript_83961:2758-4083(+)